LSVAVAGLLLALVLTCGGAALVVRAELRAGRREASLQQLLATFGPALAHAQADPRQLLAWYPVAQAARRLFGEAFAELDAAAGGTFPFTREHVNAAHARWTTSWLEWEEKHTAEFRLKAASAEEEGLRSPGADPSIVRARIAAIEREKLEQYQQHYEEYVRIAKALAALEGKAGAAAGAIE
jgi:hypothetical protein